MTPEKRKSCAEICMTLVTLLKNRGENKHRRLALLAAAFTTDDVEHRYMALCLHIRKLESEIKDRRLQALAHSAFIAMPDFTNDNHDEEDVQAMESFFKQAKREMN